MKEQFRKQGYVTLPHSVLPIEKTSTTSLRKAQAAYFFKIKSLNTVIKKKRSTSHFSVTLAYLFICAIYLLHPVSILHFE